jgi:uncharacterized protein YkwD
VITRGIFRLLIALPLVIITGLLPVSAQVATSPVNLNILNVKLLEELILKRVNALRQSLNAEELKKDEILRLAAEDQSRYMQGTGIIGHGQKVKGKETPEARVRFYKGTHALTGENCHSVYIGTPAVIYGEKETKIFTTYDQAAEALFLGWKNSPGHYKNMIYGDFRMLGIGFAADTEKKLIYATQVFGNIPYVPPAGITVTDNSHGILGSAPAACDPIKEYEFLAQLLSNRLERKGDSVFLYCHDLDYFMKVINSPSDAIALDIVERRQFPCSSPHILHGSPVHDGVMLPPVYWPALQKSNRMKAKGGMYAFAGVIPKGMKDIEINVIIIKGKRMCRYSNPICVDYAELDMFEIYPYWDTIQGKVKPDSFNVTLQYSIPFGRGKTDLLESPELRDMENAVKANSEFIKRIDIRTFSSIEGSAEINMRLQETRAANIRSKVASLTTKEVSWQVEAKENWDEFYKQIAFTPFAYLRNKPKQEIKEMLKSKTMLDSLDFMLSRQRIALIKIEMSGSYGEDIPDGLLVPAFMNAVAKGDSGQARIIQSKIIYKCIKRQLPLGALTDPEIPLEKKFVPVISNQMAAKASRPSYLFDFYYLLYTKEAANLASSYLPLKFNVASSALQFYTFSKDTLIDMDRLEEMIRQCTVLPDKQELVSRLLMNYYIVAARYYYNQHRYDKMSDALTEIKNNYYKSNLSQMETWRLARFFNMYSRFDWSMELMHPVITKEQVTEDFLFTFVRTATVWPYFLDRPEYIEWLSKAKKRNHQRFCELVRKEFQLTRDEEIRSLYCSTCNMTR